MEAKLNTVNMTAWVHKGCAIIEEEALTKLRGAWDSSEQKDECIMCLDDLERAYWMGTEVGLLGGYGFQGVTLGVDGSCKDGKMGSGCCMMMILLLLFLQKQSLAFAVYLFGIGTLHTGPGLKKKAHVIMLSP